MKRCGMPGFGALLVGMAGLMVPVTGAAELASPAAPGEAPAAASAVSAPVPHEIPADVIVRAFVKAEGEALRLVLRVPPHLDARRGLPRTGSRLRRDRRGDSHAGRSGHALDRGVRDALRGSGAACDAGRHGHPDFAPLGPLLRRLRSCGRAHVGPSDPARRRPGPGTGHAGRGPRDPHSVRRFTLLDRSRVGPPGDSHDHRAALRHARGRGAGLSVHGQSRAGTPRSQVASGAAALRRARLRPHPGRNRPPPLPALPRRSAAALLAARVGGHGVHGRALDHAGRLGSGSRAQRAVVPPADRDADCGLDRVHGAGEHRRQDA